MFRELKSLIIWRFLAATILYKPLKKRQQDCVEELSKIRAMLTQEFSTNFKTTLVGLLIVEIIVGVLCSSSVLLIYWRKKRIKSVANTLIANLAAMDFLLCGVGMPMTIISLTRFPNNTLLFCCFHEAFTSALRTASFITLLLISYDRYWSVTQPFRIWMDLGKARKAILMCWFLTVLFTVIPFIELHVRDTASLDAPCSHWFRNSSDRLHFRLYYFPIFLISCAVLLSLYFRISRAALFRLRLQSVAMTSAFIVPVMVIKPRKETALSRQKKLRIARLTGAIVCSACGLWLPYMTLSFVLYFVDATPSLSRLEFVFLVLGYFNCILNPLLYAFTKHGFRNACFRLLPCKQYREQKTAPL